MKWLIWREIRLNRVILIAGAILLLAPFVIVLLVLLNESARSTGQPSKATTTFVIGAMYSLAISQLTIALLGGYSFAGERSDRSAEFMAYLPIRRIQRLAAKLILLLTVVALIWAVNYLALSMGVRAATSIPSPNQFYEMLPYFAVTGIAFFGGSWLISSFQSSPTYAAAGGLFAPLLVIMTIYSPTVVAQNAWDLGEWRRYEQFVGMTYLIACTVLGIVCFAIGTWYYLRRVKP